MDVSVFACAVHRECTIGVNGEGIKACAGCADFVSADRRDKRAASDAVGALTAGIPHNPMPAPGAARIERQAVRSDVDELKNQSAQDKTGDNDGG
jgi:hypothetical protein